MDKTPTSRRLHASGDNFNTPGSLPGGPTPVHHRVHKLRHASSHLATERVLAQRMSRVLDADSPLRSNDPSHPSLFPHAETPSGARSALVSHRGFQDGSFADSTIYSIADASSRTETPPSIWGRETTVGTPIPLSRNTPLTPRRPARSMWAFQPAPSTPRAQAAPPGGYYAEAGGLGGFSNSAQTRRAKSRVNSPAAENAADSSTDIRRSVSASKPPLSTSSAAEPYAQTRASTPGRQYASVSALGAPRSERDARRGPSHSGNPPAGPPSGSRGPLQQPTPPVSGSSEDESGGGRGGGSGGNGSGHRRGGSTHPEPSRNAGRHRMRPAHAGSPTLPAGVDPDDSYTRVDLEDSSDEDAGDDLRARRKLVSQMKIKQPRVYDGRADIDAFDQWCYEVDLWKQLNGVRTRWAIPMMSNFLSDRANRWFMTNIVLSDEQWSMRKFYDELFDYCFPSDFKLTLRKKFSEAVQGDRDVREFARELQVMARRFPDIGERQLVQVLWEGVPRYIRAKWFEYGFNVDENSFEELVGAAEQFENGERARRSDESHWSAPRDAQSDFERSEDAEDVSASGDRVSESSPDSPVPDEVLALREPTRAEKYVLRAEGRCFHCKMVGHFRRDCPVRHRHWGAPISNDEDLWELGVNEKSRLRAEGKCFLCQGEGHFSRECPARESSQQPVAAGAYGTHIGRRSTRRDFTPTEASSADEAHEPEQARHRILSDAC